MEGANCKERSLARTGAVRLDDSTGNSCVEIIFLGTIIINILEFII
jgi:hypothetical protein